MDHLTVSTGATMNVPTQKELLERQIAERRRRAFAPAAMAAMLRGQSRRKARLRGK